MNKCKSFVGSATQLCALGLTEDFVITTRDAKPGLVGENEATPLQDHEQVGAACRCDCIAQCFMLYQERFPTDKQANV